jgi:adhesin/invasin
VRKRAFLRSRLLPVAVALVAVQGCENVTVTEVGVASISVTPGTATLLPDEEAHLAAIPRGVSGTALSNRVISWRSENTAVASVDPSGRVHARSPGTSRIEASSGGVVGTAVVTVNPAPGISLSRTAVVLGGVAGGGATPPEVIQVSNAGGGALSGLRVEVGHASGQPAGWLDAGLQGSAAPTTLTLRARPHALAAGTYGAEVRVISPQAANSPRIVAVTFEVGAALPVIRLSPEALGFSTSEGQGAPPAQTVTVTNAGGGELTNLSTAVNYAPGSAPGWLSAELDRATAPAAILLRVDPSGLSTGVFDATVQVTSPDAPGGGATVQVRLRRGDPPPQIDVVPNSLQISMEEGAASPMVVPVRVANAGAGQLGGLSSQVRYADPAVAAWLESSLRAPVAPTVLDLRFSTTNLLPGTHTAQVMLASPDAVNSPLSVGVQLVVRPRPSGTTSTVTAAPDTIVADGTSSSEITVVLNDPRGGPIPSGGDSVEVFTTAGTLSAVSSLGSGRYRATLSSSTTVETATVTARLRGVEIEDSATVHFRSHDPDAGPSTVAVNPATIPVGSTSTVTVQRRDAAGNPVTTSGDTVFLATDLGTLTPTGGVTTDGVFASTFSSTTPGTATLTAYLGSDTEAPRIGTATVTVEAGPPDVGQSAMETTSGGSEMPAAGSLTIRIQLRDAAGNDVTGSGDPIFFTTDLGELDPVSGTTTEGSFESVFTSGETGTATIAAYLGEDDGGELIGTLTLTVSVRTADPGTSTITSDRTHIPLNGSASIRVLLRDAAGEPLTSSGTPIFLTTSRGQVAPASGTSTEGVFASVFTSTQTGNTVITAYLGEDAQGALIGSVEVVVQGNAGAETAEMTGPPGPSRGVTIGTTVPLSGQGLVPATTGGERSGPPAPPSAPSASTIRSPPGSWPRHTDRTPATSRLPARRARRGPPPSRPT